MYRKLRGKLKELDIDHVYLAKLFDVSPPTISYRMTGKIPWRIDEMYVILDLIQEPENQLHAYFPRGGIAAQ